MKIYVGNLSYSTTEEQLREKFVEHGEVEEVAVVTDRYTGRARGFGFVTMPPRHPRLLRCTVKIPA